MGVFVVIFLIITAISWFISRVVYVKQVKNEYKNPMLAATLVFLLSFVILAGGLFLLFVSAFSWGRH
jgi:hypothetical protein